MSAIRNWEFMKLVLGSDHAGFELKSALSAWLLDMGHQIYDVGGFSEERVDYPEFGSRAQPRSSRR